MLKEILFYLYNLSEKIIYRFKNNDHCFWILKCRVFNTIFSLYFYFEFFYYCILCYPHTTYNVHKKSNSQIL